MIIRGGKLNTGFFAENKKSEILYHRGAMNICTNMEPPTTLTDHSRYKFLSRFLNKQAYSIPPLSVSHFLWHCYCISTICTITLTLAYRWFICTDAMLHNCTIFTIMQWQLWCNTVIHFHTLLAPLSTSQCITAKYCRGAKYYIVTR